MRARGNTAAFTIESSYRARLDWDRIPQDASLVRRSGFEGGRSARNARVRLVDTALRDNWWIRLKMHGQDAFRYPAGDYS